jgi:hypothetical protein
VSRSYAADLAVDGFNRKRKAAIIKAADEEWDFDDTWDMDGGKLIAGSGGTIGGGEAEDECAHRLNRAIQKANGKACRVRIVLTCLEEVPTTVYSFTE